MEKKKKIKKAELRKRIQEKKEQMRNVYGRMNRKVKSG
jgi:ribosomal protein S1